jgi:hypothetical protein
VCLSFCGTTKSQEVWSLEVGGIFPSFILAHTPYVSSPCTHFLCFVPPCTFFSNHQMQKEGRISLSFHQPLSIPIEDEEEWYSMKELLTLEKCCEEGCL